MRTRFAPSPTGPLHLGHAYSALLAFDLAKQAGGEFLLRIEDIDQSRARHEWEQKIYDDLAWLGITWSEPVLRQSDRLSTYQSTISQLWWDGLLYKCTCNRRDILDAISAPQENSVTYGADGIIYPGTCRNSVDDRDHYPSLVSDAAALRLDWSSYPRGLSSRLRFTEMGSGPRGESGLIDVELNRLMSDVGDVVLSRKGMGTSYHLSVVLDDAAQGVTDVVRGQDLYEATHIHVALQALLNLSTPTYHHHKLIRDAAGKRLAKRDDARAIATYRMEGATPDDIRRLVCLPTS